MAVACLLLLPFLLAPAAQASTGSEREWGTQDFLDQDSSLWPGQFLKSGQFYLRMQLDCGLVITREGLPQAIWASYTEGKGETCVLTMRPDGNLVVHEGGFDYAFIWQSYTSSSAKNVSYQLKLEQHPSAGAIAVIYLTTHPDNLTIDIWSTINPRPNNWWPFPWP